jgi:hypothetical protein
MSASAPELVEGRSAFAARALEFVGVARLEIVLLSHGLDRALYGSEGFVDAVQRFGLNSERARMLILLNQPQLAARGGHRLVELGRRLPSRIEFRELLPERIGEAHGECLIVDGRALLVRESMESLAARCWRDAPTEGRRLREPLMRWWEESPPAQELRRLGL